MGPEHSLTIWERLTRAQVWNRACWAILEAHAPGSALTKWPLGHARALVDRGEGLPELGPIGTSVGELSDTGVGRWRGTGGRGENNQESSY